MLLSVWKFPYGKEPWLFSDFDVIIPQNKPIRYYPFQGQKRLILRIISLDFDIKNSSIARYYAVFGTIRNYEHFLPVKTLLAASGKNLHSTKQAPPVFGFAGGIAQHRLSPVPNALFPHPLQNRVPRVRVLLPLPKNRRKHCVSAGFLFTCVVWLWCSRWFRHQVFASICTCLQPLSTPPAPKTHPVLPFSAQSGCVFSFFALLDVQNFRDIFCSLCRIAFTD